MPMKQSMPTAENIREVLCAKLKRKPKEGVPLQDLVKSVRAKWPRKLNGQKGYGKIWGQVWWMGQRGLIERVAHGVWRCVASQARKLPQAESVGGKKEAGWYNPVKDQLVEMRKCASARVVGNEVKPGKWKNPDIVGAVVPGPIAEINGFKSKIMAVEVKRARAADAFLTGFAQACSYQSFAHMALLVVPEWDNPVVERVRQLCVRHGVGFAVFAEDGKDGRLEISISPRCHDPDPGEFTEFLDRLGIRRIEELGSSPRGGRKRGR